MDKRMELATGAVAGHSTELGQLLTGPLHPPSFSLEGSSIIRGPGVGTGGVGTAVLVGEYVRDFVAVCVTAAVDDTVGAASVEREGVGRIVFDEDGDGTNEADRDTGVGVAGGEDDTEGAGAGGPANAVVAPFTTDVYAYLAIKAVSPTICLYSFSANCSTISLTSPKLTVRLRVVRLVFRVYVTLAAPLACRVDRGVDTCSCPAEPNAM